MSAAYAPDDGLEPFPQDPTYGPPAPQPTEPPPFVPPPVQGVPVQAAPPPPVAAPEMATAAPAASANPNSPEVVAQATEDLGAMPERPALTGNAAKDVQNNVEYTRKLQDQHQKLLVKQDDIAKKNAVIEAERSKNELAEAKRIQAEREKEAIAYQARQAEQKQQITEAVSGKATAMKDLTNAGKDETFGMKLGRSIAIALGGLGQALMVKGGVHGAQNEGLRAVNDQMAQDYQRRKDRLAAASAAVMEARYGFKDNADNHRAAMNDLDTEQAAKWKLIAKEADDQLKRQGADPQLIANNIVKIQALQEAAKYEDSIQAREEATDVHRQTAAATLAMSGAHLGLAERQAKATEDQRRFGNYERIVERKDRITDREERQAQLRAELADKLKVAEEKKAIFNPRTGEVAGKAPTEARAQVATKELESIQNVRDDVKALKDNVSQGAVFPSLPGIGAITDASAQRESLAKSLITRLSSFKGLGAISSDDRKILDAVISGGWRQAMGMSGKQLDSIMTAVDKAEATTLRSQGIKTESEAPAKADAPRETPKAETPKANKYSALPQTATVNGETWTLNPATGKYRRGR